MNCSTCGKSLEINAKSCPVCGNITTSKEEVKNISTNSTKLNPTDWVEVLESTEQNIYTDTFDITKFSSDEIVFFKQHKFKIKIPPFVPVLLNYTFLGHFLFRVS